MTKALLPLLLTLTAVASLTAIEPQSIYQFQDEGVEAPVFTKRVAPIYPKDAVDEEIETFVVLEAIFHKDGTISNVVSKRKLPEGEEAFVRNAKAALMQWKYEPAKVNGKLVDFRMTLKINFQLN